MKQLGPKGGIVVGLIIVALGLVAYKSGRLSLLGEAINGSAVINR